MVFIRPDGFVLNSREQQILINQYCPPSISIEKNNNGRNFYESKLMFLKLCVINNKIGGEISPNTPIQCIFQNYIHDAIQIRFLIENTNFITDVFHNIPIIDYSIINSNEFIFTTKRSLENFQIKFKLEKNEENSVNIPYENHQKTDDWKIQITIEKYNKINFENLEKKMSQYITTGKHLIEIIMEVIWPEISNFDKKRESSKMILPSRPFINKNRKDEGPIEFSNAKLLKNNKFENNKNQYRNKKIEENDQPHNSFKKNYFNENNNYFKKNSAAYKDENWRKKQTSHV